MEGYMVGDRTLKPSGDSLSGEGTENYGTVGKQCVVGFTPKIWKNNTYIFVLSHVLFWYASLVYTFVGVPVLYLVVVKMGLRVKHKR